MEMRELRLLTMLSSAAICLNAQSQPAVDLLVTHGLVVTMDAGRRVLPDGAIAIRGDTITEVGASGDIANRYHAARIVDAHGALVLPGLINAHTHMPMSLFRGLAEDRALDEWLHKFIFPAEARNVTPEFVSWGTSSACSR